MADASIPGTYAPARAPAPGVVTVSSTPSVPTSSTRRAVRGPATHPTQHHLDLARVLRLGAAGLTGLFLLVAGIFVIGETMADPGGWAGAGLIALWLVPSLVTAVLVLRRLDLALPLLIAATLASTVLAAWAVVPSSDWAEVEDRVGPIRAIVAVALTGLLGLLGWFRARAAGSLLLLVAVTPAAGVALGRLLGAVLDAQSAHPVVPMSLQVASAPALVIGALYLPGSHRQRSPLVSTPQFEEDP